MWLKGLRVQLGTQFNGLTKLIRFSLFFINHPQLIKNSAILGVNFNRLPIRIHSFIQVSHCRINLGLFDTVFAVAFTQFNRSFKLCQSLAIPLAAKIHISEPCIYLRI